MILARLANIAYLIIISAPTSRIPLPSRARERLPASVPRAWVACTNSMNPANREMLLIAQIPESRKCNFIDPDQPHAANQQKPPRR